MPRLLKNLVINEVSAVFKGANPGALVMIRKADDDPPYLFEDIMERRKRQSPFAHISLHKAAVSGPLRGPREGDDSDKVLAKLNAMVDAMFVATPSISREQAAHYLLHNAHGRRLAEHLNNLSKGETIMPQVDILKVATILEDGLNAQVTKRDGESFAQAFSRKYQADEDWRRQWASVTEAKHTVALSKGMASLTPTSLGVGNTNVSDDSAEAVRLLNEMCEKQGRSFESVFSDPANSALAQKTYTSAHRSSINTDYLEQ
jgi:hypothetical protein